MDTRKTLLVKVLRELQTITASVTRSNKYKPLISKKKRSK